MKSCKTCEHWTQRITYTNKIKMPFGWCEKRLHVDYWDSEKAIYKNNKVETLKSSIIGENIHTGQDFLCNNYKEKNA